MTKTFLLFYRGSGFVAWWIRWWTKSKFSHVAPAIFGNLEGGAIYDAFWATGVTKRPWAGTDGLATIVELPNADPAYWGPWLDQQVGKKYDKWSIFIIGLTKRTPAWLHIYVSRQDEWICSRLACVVGGFETLAWGIKGPPSPEDDYEFTKIIAPIAK